MTKARVATLLVLLMLLPALPAGARSVHSTADVDLFPQGVFDEAADWTLEDSVSFSTCLLYTSPSPRDGLLSRMPSSA